MLIRENRPTINFLDSYRTHYGGQEDVVIQCLEPLTDEEGALRLTLACHRPDFCHFQFSANDSPSYSPMDNSFLIRFGQQRTWKGTARPVYDGGAGSTTYEIAITLKTSQEYSAGGDPLPTRFDVQITPPLECESRTPESWGVPAPTKEERRFAKATWGKHLKGAKTDYAKAQALAKALCHELWPHNGAPLPELQYYSAFEMYRAMVSGKSKGFCVQFNMIFVHACKCFGVIARNMHIERPVRYDERCWVLLQGMHTTAEVFDRTLNRWIFTDIRFYCLGAYLGDEGPLSTGEFHLFISQPYWRDRLRFEVYDMTTRKVKRLPMQDCPRTDIHFYSGWNTVFHVGYE